jgi:AcrR family transcriptional regulator
VAVGGETEASTTAQTEERILDGARTCFSRFGLRKTAMEDIAREAGLSRGTLYRYFPDKEALYRAVSERETRFFLEEIEERTAGVDTLGEKVIGVLLAAIEFLRENPMNAAMAATDPEAFAAAISTNGRELLELAVEGVTPMVREAIDKGEVRSDLDPAQAAEWIVRVELSLISTPSVTFDRDDPAELRRFLLGFLLPGLQ